MCCGAGCLKLTLNHDALQIIKVREELKITNVAVAELHAAEQV